MGFTKQVLSGINSVGNPMLRKGLKKAISIQGRMERGMFGTQQRISNEKARKIIKDVAGRDVDFLPTMRPVQGSHYNPGTDSIEAQPFAPLVAHEARHARQAEMARNVGEKIMEHLPTERLPANREHVGMIAPTTMGIAVNRLADAPYKSKRAAALGQIPRLVTEGDANRVAMKYPGGGRTAAASMGSYITGAIANVRKAGKKELRSELQDIIEFGARRKKQIIPRRKGGAQLPVMDSVPGDSPGATTTMRSKLTAILQFSTDPRPRNRLGEFSNDDGSPNQAAIHATYRQGLAEGALGGIGAVKGGQMLSKVLRKVRK